MVAVAATSASAVENKLFLDFDRDHNLWTIEDRSLAPQDTVTLILEFHEVPAEFRFHLTYETDCGIVDHGDGPQHALPASIWWGDGVGCNEEIVTDCEWGEQDCNHDCTCYQPYIGMRLLESAPILPNRRYELARFVIERNPYGAEGRVRIVSSPYWEGSELASNDVWIGPTVLPVEQATWGKVKSQFRDRSLDGN